MLVSSKVCFGKKGFKYFIGYKDYRKVRPTVMYNASKNEHIQKRFWWNWIYVYNAKYLQTEIKP